MKDGFKSIVIEPFNGYLDFQGPINPQETTGNITLKGDIRMKLTKTVKVKSAALKFKGTSRVCHQNAVEAVDISTPILPKLKTQLFSSTTSLGPGEVTLPWEMEILNIYPSSVMIKRVSITYKIELTISMGLNRIVKAEYPIVLRRHLLPSLQAAPLVAPKLYTKTVSTKFHYEINAPRIVCVAQETMPMTIKLLTIGAPKRVLSIRTQLLQVELYRCGGLSKTDADMTKFKTHSLGPKGTGSASGKKTEGNKYAKYTKRTAPATIHTLDETIPMPANQSLLIRHPLAEYLNMGLESPLASIYHQMEITFRFGAKCEDIRAKIPIVIASSGPDQLTNLQNGGNQQQQQHEIPTAPYPFEKIPVIEPISVMNERRMDRNTASIRTPTTTPTINSNDTAAMEEEEDDDDDDVETMDAFPHNNNSNSKEHTATGFSNATNFLEPDSHSLRRARSAVDLVPKPMDPGLILENFDTQPPKTTNQRQNQQQQSSTNISPLPSSIYSKPSLDIPAIENTSPHSESKRPLDNGMKKASGMSPYQWRRRSSSQPYLDTDRMTNSKPPKDPKRHQPNLAIIPPSLKSLRLQHSNTLSKDDLLAATTTSNDDSSLIGVSESSVSSLSSASSVAPSESINSSNASSHYEPQSRPISPSFATAPGLPSFIPLHQEAVPVALLEESFILSPSSMTSSSAHTLLPLSPYQRQLQRTSPQYAQADTHKISHSGPSRTSVISNAQSSVLDPDENMIQMMQAMETQYWQQMQQKKSLEQHYTNAKLPPLPTTLDLRQGRRQTTIYYGDDSSDDDDDDSFRTNDMCNTNDIDDIVCLPPITVSPLPPPPLPPLAQKSNDDDDGLVCLCPKHGVVVTRR